MHFKTTKRLTVKDAKIQLIALFKLTNHNFEILAAQKYALPIPHSK